MNKMSNMTKKQSGFTLIEIAIVLVIIGLLLGGVLQGQQLIENSRVRAAANDFDGIPAAMYSYLDRYGRMPGDDGPTATLAARGAAWNGIVASAAIPDGVIVSPAASTFTGANENGLMFRMLRASGFISGNPALAGAAALPQNPFGGLTGFTNAQVMPVGATGLQGNKLCMSNVPGSAAIALDTQMDDGVGTTGRFRATDAAAGNTAPGAVIAAPYSEDSNYTVCFRI